MVLTFRFILNEFKLDSVGHLVRVEGVLFRLAVGEEMGSSVQCLLPEQTDPSCE